ncbi:MAG: hypothetical protein H6560_27975 [Lewinellaceae bacterium]|nr:hypothetical protein [Lewinellaceae bacterium]
MDPLITRPPIFLFITSLTEEEHENDRIGGILKFCNQELRRKGQRHLSEVLFPEGYRHYIDALYYREEDERGSQTAIIKVNGNAICDIGQENETAKGYWQSLKEGQVPGGDKEKDFLYRLIAGSCLDFLPHEEAFEVEVKAFIHWGVIDIKKSQAALARQLAGSFLLPAREDERQEGVFVIEDAKVKGLKAKLNIELQPYSCYPSHNYPLPHQNWEKIKESKSPAAFKACFQQAPPYTGPDFERFETRVLNGLCLMYEEKKADNLCYRENSSPQAGQAPKTGARKEKKEFLIDDFLDKEWRKIRYHIPKTEAIYGPPGRFGKNKPVRKVFPATNWGAEEKGNNLPEFPLRSYPKDNVRGPGVIKVKFTRLWNDGEVFTEIDGQHPHWGRLITMLTEGLQGMPVQLCDYRKCGSGASPDLIIAFANMKDFNDSAMFTRLSERHSFHLDDEKAGKEGISMDYYPVLTIGLMNIMIYYHDREDPRFFSDKGQIDNAFQVYRLLNLDKRFRFFDSSIWFRYLALTQDFIQGLEELLGTFEYNLNNHIYQSAEAAEYLEFQLRMLAESYFVNTHNRASGPYVTPFIFHSETRMKWLADRELAAVNHIDWRVLLVDDKAVARLFYFFSEERLPLTKYDIIKDHLTRCSPGLKELQIEKAESAKGKENMVAGAPPNSQNGGKVIIECVNNIHLAFEKITHDINQDAARQNVQLKGPGSSAELTGREYEYDLILLNYVFDLDLGGKAFIQKENSLDYGFDLITKLNKWAMDKESDGLGRELLSQALGPAQRLSILPISIYAGAMQSKLQDLGIPLSHEYWDIGNSVDPINTPDLFRFHFFYQLRKQLNQLSFIDKEKNITKAIKLSNPKKKKNTLKARRKREKDFFEKYNQLKRPGSLLLHYFNEIVPKAKSSNQKDNHDSTGEMAGSGLRFTALRQFPNIVELGVRFKRLYLHKDQNAMAEMLINQHFFGLTPFAWDHLQNLVYLLTYGTFQQKQEMWEEFIFLSKALSKSAQPKEEKFRSFQKALDAIASYIHNLGSKSS